MSQHWFFPLSKILWLLVAPSHIIVWLAVAAAGFLIAGRQRLGRGLAVATACLLAVFSIVPVGSWLVRPLENEYPRPALPPHVDGILVLGGGLGTQILFARGVPASGQSEMRLISAFELARRYPQARVVFSGGWGRFADAYAAAYIFRQVGLDPARLTIEGRSRNTYENFTFTEALVRPKLGEVWILATSAIQMPRAMAVARRTGWTLIPWATDYDTTRRAKLWRLMPDMDIADNLRLTDVGVHEWIGLAAYGVNHMAAAPQGGARP